MPGMDHAGIATQNVVERELAKQRQVQARPRPRGIRGEGLGVEGRVRRQDPRADAPPRRRRRLEPRAVHHGRWPVPRPCRTIFKRLYDDGLIYRAERIINWCVRCHTALSDIEVEHTDDEGELVSIRYGDPTDESGRGGDHARRDDARRHRRSRPPRRRALCAPGRHRRSSCRSPAGGSPSSPTARRSGVRHRRGQGHPGARPQRLRDRAAARAAEPTVLNEHGRITAHGTLSTAWTGSTPGRGEARAAGTGPHRRGARPYVHRSGTAPGPTTSSSRGCPPSGSSRWRRSRRRQVTPYATAGR